ncbi:MAG: hypothetical protein ACE5I1_32365 [bacterium]
MIGSKKISKFIEDLVKPYILTRNLETAYKQMANDEERENAELEWSEALISDVSHETR